MPKWLIRLYIFITFATLITGGLYMDGIVERFTFDIAVYAWLFIAGFLAVVLLGRLLQERDI